MPVDPDPRVLVQRPLYLTKYVGQASHCVLQSGRTEVNNRKGLLAPKAGES